MSRIQKAFAIVVSCLIVNSIYGHEIEEYNAPVEFGGFFLGAIHPALGPDHLLAMLSVGILSAQKGGSAIWKVPTTFVTVMLIGGLTGLLGVKVAGIEAGIAISVLVLGLALFMEAGLPNSWAMLIVAFFGFFHGYAHGVEMPSVAEPLWYALGFVVSTAVIHVTGLLIGFLFTRTNVGKGLLRLTGSVIAGTGGYYLMGGLFT